MAYISKEEVKAKSIKLKEINSKFSIKSTFSGSNTSSLRLTIHSGKIDFIKNYVDKYVNDRQYGDIITPEMKIERMKAVSESGYIQVNAYCIDNMYDGIALQYLKVVKDLMFDGHYDDSDARIDYFSCSWYNEIHIGKYNKPYETC